jgi:hypothetical protein
MPVIERSAVVPLPLEETWEAIFGDRMQNWVRLSDAVVEVRDYRMRPDGTPEYVMVNRAGPMKMSHRSDYVAYDPPHRAAPSASSRAANRRCRRSSTRGRSHPQRIHGVIDVRLDEPDRITSAVGEISCDCERAR